MSDLVKIARERIDGTQATHWVGCERDHRECLIQRMADEIERLRADAERYRWLRGDSCPDHSVRWTQWEVRRWEAPFWTGDLRRADLDDAIDAARGKE